MSKVNEVDARERHVVTRTFLPVGLPGTSLILVAARQPKGVQRAHRAVYGLHHGNIRAPTYSKRP
jgi:hypothetical protein